MILSWEISGKRENSWAVNESLPLPVPKMVAIYLIA